MQAGPSWHGVSGSWHGVSGSWHESREAAENIPKFSSPPRLFSRVKHRLCTRRLFNQARNLSATPAHTQTASAKLPHKLLTSNAFISLSPALLNQVSTASCRHFIIHVDPKPWPNPWPVLCSTAHTPTSCSASLQCQPAALPCPHCHMLQACRLPACSPTLGGATCLPASCQRAGTQPA